MQYKPPPPVVIYPLSTTDDFISKGPIPLAGSTAENPLLEKNDLSIYVRPEIRKSCAWDINLKFSPEIIEKEKLEQIFIEKPRGGAGKSMPFLCVKVRSKIKPVLELPFAKVGTIINESDYIECNESGTAVLRVKFTSRPRAVFHKHSDIMVLVVSLRRGNSTICSDDRELIFRGGTGSIHSAEGRNGNLAKKKKEVTGSEYMLSPEPQRPVYNEQRQSYPEPQRQSYPEPQRQTYHNESYQIKETVATITHTPYNVQPTPVTPVTPITPITPITPPTPYQDPKLDTNIMPLWPSDDFPDFDSTPQSLFPTYESVIDPYQQSNYPFDIISEPVLTPQYTVVFGKRRGSCKICLSECSFYRGPGGPCNECGCFPSQHIDLDNIKSL
jgi:hypothetical protein